MTRDELVDELCRLLDVPRELVEYAPPVSKNNALTCANTCRRQNICQKTRVP